jgi:hypothetical protein
MANRLAHTAAEMADRVMHERVIIQKLLQELIEPASVYPV